MTPAKPKVRGMCARCGRFMAFRHIGGDLYGCVKCGKTLYSGEIQREPERKKPEEPEGKELFDDDGN